MSEHYPMTVCIVPLRNNYLLIRFPVLETAAKLGNNFLEAILKKKTRSLERVFDYRDRTERKDLQLVIGFQIGFVAVGVDIVLTTTRALINRAAFVVFAH